MNSSPDRHPETIRGRQRRGAVILEFILVLPILIIVTLSIFEFGYLILVGQAINTAAIEGSRKAAELGGEANSAEPAINVIQEFLAVHKINLSNTQPAAANQGDAFVRVDYGTITLADRLGASMQSYTWGNSNYQVAAPGGIEDNEVIVTIRVPVNDGTVETIPNLLCYFGFDLTPYTYEYRALTPLE